MAFIKETFVGENALYLGSEEFIRPMSFGGQWRKIRIGLLYTIAIPQGLAAHTYFNSTGGGIICVGVCQGLNSGLSNPSPIDCLSCLPYTLDAQWTNSVTYYQTQSNPGRIVWKMGSTEVVVTNGSSGAVGPLWPTLNYMWFDYTMSQGVAGATAQCKAYAASNATGATTSMTRSDFLAYVEAENTIPTNHALMCQPSVAYSGNFDLNSLSIWWRRSIPMLVLAEVSVVRFQ